MAEYYSAELAEKVVRGMKENALKGISNGGQVTFGYKLNEERRYERDEVNAPIVEEIFTMYADGKTIKQIVDYLNAKQVRTSRGGKINFNAVQRMLSNRRYIGEYKFRDVIMPHAISALVPDDLFEKVQKKLEKNKKAPAQRKAEDEYLLTLKLFCGKCGAHMVGESGMGTSRVYRYYKCANTKKVHTCNKKPVRKEWIEDLAVKKALEILNDEKLISYLTDRIYVLQGHENPRIPNLKAQLEDTQKRIGNIMDAIEQGIITENTKSRLTQLESKQKELKIAILQEKIKKPFLTKEQIRFGIEKFKKLDISTQEGKQRLIDGFINSIYLFDDKLTITFNFKDGSRTVSFSEIEAAKNSDIDCVAAPKKRHGFSVSFCFGAAAGPSGSRGARAVRARAASFAPQAQAPGRCTVPCLFVLVWRQDRAGRAERDLFVREALCAAGASPRKVHGSVSFCFGVAAGSSGSRGARAVRARSALRRRRKPPEGAADREEKIGD